MSQTTAEKICTTGSVLQDADPDQATVVGHGHVVVRVMLGESPEDRDERRVDHRPQMVAVLGVAASASSVSGRSAVPGAGASTGSRSSDVRNAGCATPKTSRSARTVITARRSASLRSASTKKFVDPESASSSGSVRRCGPTELDQRGHLLLVERVLGSEVGVAGKLAAHQVSPQAQNCTYGAEPESILVERGLRLDEDDIVVVHGRDMIRQTALEVAPRPRRAAIQIKPCKLVHGAPRALDPSPTNHNVSASPDSFCDSLAVPEGSPRLSPVS